MTEITEFVGLKQTRTRELVVMLVAAGQIEESGSTKAKRYRKI